MYDHSFVDGMQVTHMYDHSFVDWMQVTCMYDHSFVVFALCVDLNRSRIN